MPEAKASFRILHITGCAAGELALSEGGAGIDAGGLNRVREWLREAGLAVDECGDVYRGLARLMGRGGRCHTTAEGGFATPTAESPAFRGAVVCVDHLDAGEMEFFDLVSRNRPDVAVLVYARSGDSPNLGKALARGAVECGLGALRQLAERGRSWATGTAAMKASMGSSAEPRRCDAATERREQAIKESSDPGIEAAAGATRVGRVLIAPAAPAAGLPADGTKKEAGAIDSSAEVKQPAGDFASGGQPEPEDSADAARVPWIRYHDAPVRQRPSTGQPPREAPQGAPLEDGDAYEPLLTEEELRALMGDELDDLDGGERESLLGPEPSPPGARKRSET